MLPAFFAEPEGKFEGFSGVCREERRFYEARGTHGIFIAWLADSIIFATAKMLRLYTKARFTPLCY